MLTSEKNNFFRKNINPLIACNTFFSILIKIPRIFIIKIYPRFFHFTMPNDIRGLQKEIANINLPFYNFGKYNFTFNSVILKISGNQNVLINNANDFKKKYDDNEIQYSLNRWGWLLNGLYDKTLDREKGIKLIQSWLHVNDLDCEKDAYSSVERIVNSAIFFSANNHFDIPFFLLEVYKKMSQNISNNLEFYGKYNTGNHIINNARGLLFAGLLTNSNKEIELSICLLKTYLPNRLNSDGFLNEKSSHYHFLFTSWLLEMYWLSKIYRKNKIYNFLIPYLYRLLKGCWFFLVKTKDHKWSYPLIGDISPDCTPEWLVALPWTNIALEIYKPEVIPSIKNDFSGLASIIDIIYDSPNIVEFKNQVFSYKNSGIHRIDWKNITLFFISSIENETFGSNHGHNDIGSFILYLNGESLLIDCGRFQYSNTILGNYGQGPFSHNIILVDGLPPSSNAPSWVGYKYKYINNFVEIIDSEKEISINYIHNGYDRISNKKLKHKREIILDNFKLTVKDIIYSNKRFDVTIRFHLNCFSNKIIYNVHDPSLYIKEYINWNECNKGGVCSTEYHTLNSCKTLELSGTYSGGEIINIENKFLLCVE
jgi:hypothetical protein